MGELMQQGSAKVAPSPLGKNAAKYEVTFHHPFHDWLPRGPKTGSLFFRANFALAAFCDLGEGSFGCAAILTGPHGQAKKGNQETIDEEPEEEKEEQIEEVARSGGLEPLLPSLLWLTPWSRAGG